MTKYHRRTPDPTDRPWASWDNLIHFHSDLKQGLDNVDYKVQIFTFVVIKVVATTESVQVTITKYILASGHFDVMKRLLKLQR
jgi:hypothetical protein